MNSPRKVTVQEFQNAITDQGVPMEEVKFVCPKCGTEQCAQDLIDAGAGGNFKQVEQYLAFSCIGRFSKDKGCNWTLGGLFQIHKLEVEYEGRAHPRFEPANLRADPQD